MMVAADYDNDAIAELLRDTLDDVSIDGEPVEWLVIMLPKSGPVELVNTVSSAGMSKDRKSDALAVAQQLNDAVE